MFAETGKKIRVVLAWVLLLLVSGIAIWCVHTWRINVRRERERVAIEAEKASFAQLLQRKEEQAKANAASEIHRVLVGKEDSPSSKIKKVVKISRGRGLCFVGPEGDMYFRSSFPMTTCDELEDLLEYELSLVDELSPREARANPRKFEVLPPTNCSAFQVVWAENDLMYNCLVPLVSQGLGEEEIRKMEFRRDVLLKEQRVLYEKWERKEEKWRREKEKEEKANMARARDREKDREAAEIAWRASPEGRAAVQRQEEEYRWVLEEARRREQKALEAQYETERKEREEATWPYWFGIGAARGFMKGGTPP